AIAIAVTSFPYTTLFRSRKVEREPLARRESARLFIELPDPSLQRLSLVRRQTSLQVIEDGERLRRGNPDGLIATVVAAGSARNTTRGRLPQHCVNHSRHGSHHALGELDSGLYTRRLTETAPPRVGSGSGRFISPGPR